MPLGPGDLREEQRLALVHRDLIIHLGFGPRDRDVDIAEMHAELVGPAGRARVRLGDRHAACQHPAVAEQLPQCGRDGACDRADRVVPRLVGTARGTPPPRIVMAMLARVPAVAGHVDPAAKGEAIVDDDDLLVMRPRGRMMPVELGMDARMPHPLHHREQGRAAEQRLDRTGIPAEQEDLELGLAFDQPQDEGAERRRFAGAVDPGFELDPRIEIPADQHDPPLGVEHGDARLAEIFLRIDDHGHLVRAFDTPAFGSDPHVQVPLSSPLAPGRIRSTP